MIRGLLASAAAVALVAGGMLGPGAPAAFASPGGGRALCIPLLMSCPSGDGGGGGSGGGGGVLDGLDGVLDGVADPTAALPSWGPIVNDDRVVFTKPAAQLGAGSLAITGLHWLGLARVPMADGSHRVVIKMVADRVSIDDFLLDVKGHRGGAALVTDDANMTLSGHVEVYLDSLTATLPGGIGLSLLADTPPPEGELPPRLLRVTLGLVGVTADRVVHTDTHQQIHAGT
ncbi:MAG TPA: hypothetical protein VL294_05785 [Pseudolysinimonas sp.]|jgi:hypothetical protein|nr:hypothetical protein [Pseudolysinimonas sp.]